MSSDNFPFEFYAPTLKEFRIEKLFNKYNVTIRLKDKCFVLIGPNGVGKSTIMKILYNFISGNLTECASVPFKKLYIRDNSSEWEYLYEDFFPTVEFAAKTYEKSVLKLIGDMDEFDGEYYRISEGFEPEEPILTAFKKLQSLNLWEQFCYLSHKGKTLPEKIIKVLYSCEINPDIFSKAKFTDSDRVLSNVRLFRGSKLWDYYNESSLQAPFSDDSSSSDNVFNGFTNLCCYFDMVQSYTLENRTVSKSLYKDRETEWAYSNPHELESHPELKRSINCKHYNESIFDEDDIPFSPSLAGKARNELRDFLLDEHKLDINKLINATFYSPQLILQINNTASDIAAEFYSELDNTEIPRPFDDYEPFSDEYYIPSSKDFDMPFGPSADDFELNDGDLPFDFTENDPSIEEYQKRVSEHLAPLKKEFEKINSFYTDEIKEGYEKYIAPILVNNSFFETNVSVFGIETYNGDLPVWSEDSNNYFYVDDNGASLIRSTLYRKKLFEFISKVLPILKNKDNISPEVKTYEAMLKKYMKDKYVTVSPAGICIKDSVLYKEGDNRIVVYDEEPIDLSVISSGERKIIILFAVSIFLEDVFIMLDEPELSLSLVWQEMLLPDMIEHGKQWKIAVATHSPYIVQDEAMRPYIVYLPQQED